MKKTLLSLAILLGLSGAAKAANIVEDWTNAKEWAVTSWTQGVTTPEARTSTATGITYNFMGANVGNYLFVDAKKNAGAYVSFTLPIECAEIILTTTSGCSTNAQSTVNVYAGETKIAEAVAVNVHNADVKVPVPVGSRAAGTVYKIETNTNKYNQQFNKFTYVEATTAPTLSAAVESATFAVPLNGKQEVTVKATAENITENIAVSVDNDAFTLSSASLTAAEAAEGVVVTYNGKAVGNTSATLTFSVGDLKAEVALSGITVANEGTEANPLTVADVIALANVNKGPFYVEGIINEKTAANAVDGKIQEAATPAATNIILKDAEGNMIPVALPSGDNRAKLNIVYNPSNVGKTVIVKGTLEAYYGATGVKNAEYVSGLDSTTGIEDIDIDSVNAPVEYFNLQGVRVANPENGLFIRRQGNKVTKVIIK